MTAEQYLDYRKELQEERGSLPDRVLALEFEVDRLKKLVEELRFAREIFEEATAKLAVDRFPKECFCRDAYADIFSEKIELMGEPVATLQVFMNDGAELALLMDADHSAKVLINKIVPIHFCPFCGRPLYKKEDDE